MMQPDSNLPAEPSEASHAPSSALVPLEGEILAAAEELPSGATLALWTVLERLEQAIDQETAELRSLRAADFGRMNETKSRLLLDISRAIRAARDEISDERLTARLASLRVKLEQNRHALTMHLDAVRDIANAMTTALMEAESDGTYSAGMSAQLAPQLARVRAR